MNNNLTRLLALFMLFSVVSCKKSGRAANDPAIVGDWTLVSTLRGNTVVVFPDFTIQRNLSFRSDGTLYETHNDSTAGIDLLVPDPVIPLVKSITETASYQTVSLSAACAPIKFPAIMIKGQTGCVQYSISHDTLTISASTCLAPYYSIYVRK